jgi:hypothetical protein
MLKNEERQEIKVVKKESEKFFEKYKTNVK